MADGKSTLAMLLNGILEPTSGTIYIDNIETTNDELIFEIRRKVGVVFQNPDNQIISSVVNEDVAFGPGNLGMTPEEIDGVVDRALNMTRLNEYKEHSTNKLSGGEKQRLAISGVLAMNPKCIILDEATSMLDRKGAKQVLDIIKKLNTDSNITIIQITHNMEEVVLDNRVIVINRGEIVLDDKPLEVFNNISLLKEIDLALPLPTKLAYELNKEGVNIPVEKILTCDDCVNALSDLLKGANRCQQ